jgi:hypothetical protein
MKRFLFVVVLSFLIIGCEEESKDYNDSLPPIAGQSGPGIWCVDKRINKYGFQSRYLEKYSFDGKLMYRSSAFEYLTDLEVMEHTGDLVVIQDRKYLIKRDDAGNQLASKDFGEQYEFCDVSVDQLNDTLWYSRRSKDAENRQCDIFHTDNSLQPINDNLTLYSSYVLGSNSNGELCWTNSYLDESDYTGKLVKINQNNEIESYFPSYSSPSYSDLIRPSNSDNAICLVHGETTIDKFSIDSGEKIISLEFDYRSGGFEVNQNDGSMFFLESPFDSYGVDSTLYRIDSNGAFIWSIKINGIAMDMHAGSLWVAVPPNLIYQVSFDGEILNQIETDCEEIETIAVWTE